MDKERMFQLASLATIMAEFELGRNDMTDEELEELLNTVNPSLDELLVLDDTIQIILEQMMGG